MHLSVPGPQAADTRAQGPTDFRALGPDVDFYGFLEISGPVDFRAQGPGPQNVGRVWISRKKIHLAPFGAIWAHFVHGPEKSKKSSQFLPPGSVKRWGHEVFFLPIQTLPTFWATWILILIILFLILLGPKFPAWAQLGPTHLGPAWAHPRGPSLGPPTWISRRRRRRRRRTNSQIQIQAPPNAPRDEILPQGNPRC